MRINNALLSSFLLLATDVPSGSAFSSRSFLGPSKRSLSVATRLKFKTSSGLPGNGTSLVDLPLQLSSTAAAVTLEDEEKSRQTLQELEQLYASITGTSQESNEEEWSLLTNTDAATVVGDDKKQEGGGFLGMSEVVTARLLLLGAAALYGTNFSLVKLLGETGMSVGLSSTLRFGFAALATMPMLLSVEEEDKDHRWETLFNPKSTEFKAAMGGLEVGK
jgi:hypothetical protein